VTLSAPVDWSALEELAARAADPAQGPGHVPGTAWRQLAQTLDRLEAERAWIEIVRLRRLFTPLFARDTMGGFPLLLRLDEAAIGAARQMGDKRTLASLLGAQGHNLHRQGYHQEAIGVFEESAALYREAGESFSSLKSYYMTALCHRALDRRRQALQVLEEILAQVPADDPWRGNPLQVQAWLAQDEGQLAEAERLLRQALVYQRQTKDPDILVAGTLADLGEIQGLLDRPDEAEQTLQESIAILARHGGQYERQAARSRLKLAELLMRQKRYEEALSRLDEADDLIRLYGHYYDLMWRIELARALIFLRLGQARNAARKFRTTLRYRRELELPLGLLMRQLLRRLVQGSGLPR